MGSRTSGNSNRDSNVVSSTRNLLVGLVLAHLTCVVIAIGLFSTIPPSYYLPLWPRWQTIFLEGLAIAQIGLLATWLGVGQTSLAARMSSVVLVIVFWVTLFGWLTLDHENWFNFFMIVAFGVGGGLSIARLFGLTLSNLFAETESVPRSRFGQFSVWQMLSWFTIAAFLLYFVSVGREHWHTPSDYMKGPRSLALGLSFVAISLVAVWAYLRNRSGLLPASLAVLVAVLASLVVGEVDVSVRRVAWALRPKSYEAAYWCQVFVASVLLHVSLACVRRCGYRLIRRPRAN